MDYGFTPLQGQYKWGENVVTVLGPFHGFHVVVCVREMGEIGGKFAASYKLCTHPGDERAAAAPERSVSGVADSVQQAVNIAEQLARLHLAGLPLVRQAARLARNAASDRSSGIRGPRPAFTS